MESEQLILTRCRKTITPLNKQTLQANEHATWGVLVLQQNAAPPGKYNRRRSLYSGQSMGTATYSRP